MPMYSLITYSNYYSRISESLYQFYRNVPHATITDSQSFKFKSIFLDNNNNAGIVNIEVTVP